MKKLLIPTALAFMLASGPAHAGYFAFHADVTGTIEDLFGHYGRPDDDTPACDPELTPDCPDVDEGGDVIIVTPDSWSDWLLSLFGL